MILFSSHRVLPVLLGVLLLAGCRTDDKDLPVITEIGFEKEGTLRFVRPDGSVITTIDVEVAESDSAQVRGLMGRRSLPPQSGMLFLNEEAEPRSFWMKNTPLPLDIIFVGPDSSVVNVVRNTVPFSEASIASAGPAQYVVEVRAGFTARHGIDEDTRISFSLE